MKQKNSHHLRVRKMGERSWQAQCECGFKAPVRNEYSRARQDELIHLLMGSGDLEKPSTTEREGQ